MYGATTAQEAQDVKIVMLEKRDQPMYKIGFAQLRSQEWRHNGRDQLELTKGNEVWRSSFEFKE